MQTFEDYVEEQLRPYAEGLSGDAAAVQQALAQLEHDLPRDLLVFDLGDAALLRAGEIATARHDLPPDERLALVAGVLRLQLDWMGRPFSSRAVAYPLLDAVARDEGLPASLRSEAANLLAAEARRCIEHLLLHLGEPLPWAENAGAPDADDVLFDRLSQLPALFHAVKLVECPTLAAEWRPTLIRAVTLAATELMHDLETDADFRDQPQGYHLAGILAACDWLPTETRAELQGVHDRYKE